MDENKDTNPLTEWRDGFNAGLKGAPREKHRTGQYRRAWARGVKAREDEQMWAEKRLMREMKGQAA